MTKYHIKKSELLGMNFSKASYQLLRLILFDFVKITNQNNCYRCNKEINSVKELSVEHKISWQSSHEPLKTFFDLNNISYSHKSCNSKAAVNPRKRWNNRLEARRSRYEKENEIKRANYSPLKRRANYIATDW